MCLQDEINFFAYKKVKEISSYIAGHDAHSNADLMHTHNDPLYPCRPCIINGI